MLPHGLMVETSAYYDGSRGSNPFLFSKISLLHSGESTDARI